MEKGEMTALILGSGVVGTIIGGLINNLFTRKKRNAEIEVLELEALQKKIDIFQEVFEEQKTTIEQMKEQIRELRASYNGLQRMYEAMCDNCIYRKNYKKQ